jgi:DNA-binding transcriptional ArsR family regulator
MPPRKKTTRAKKRTPGKAPRKPRQAESLTLSNLEQVKVLADPLRIRILEELCMEERTTKQVAQRLGEKPTKLYHHVEALDRVGLIRLTRTRQNRGTLEKYYMAVARTFRADASMFSVTDTVSKPEGDVLQAMVSTVFERTSDEMRELIAQGCGQEGLEEQGVLSYLEIQVDEKHGRQIQARLMRLIKSLQDSHKGGKKRGAKSYRLTIAFYPLDVGR